MTVGRTLFGMEPDDVARVSVRDAAQGSVLGLQQPETVWKPETPIAVRYQKMAEDCETAQIDMVEKADAEDSTLDDDLI